MRFYQECLECHKINNSQTYTCDCVGESWSKQYRILDIKYDLSPAVKKRAVQSFENYDLNDSSGMLQYYLIPYRQFLNDAELTFGSTPFIFLNKLAEFYGIEVFLKYEADNPSGCFKDRETVVAALNSLAMGKNKAVIYSDGNAATSASLIADEMNIQLITFVAGNTNPEKIDYIRKKGIDVIRLGDSNISFEAGYRLFSEMNAEGIFLENGFDNWSVQNPYRIIGDKSHAIEIVKQFEEMPEKKGTVPEYVVVPTGNGSCLDGIWKGFKELKELGIIGKLPKMVSAAIKNGSPVFKAWKNKITDRPVSCSLDKVSESDKEVGSAILAEEGYDSIEATKAIIESGGLAMEVTKQNISNALADLLEKEHETVYRYNLLPEPASLVTLAAIKKLSKAGILKNNSSAVAFISGHGAKSEYLLMKILSDRPELQTVLSRIIDIRMINKTRYAVGDLINVGMDSRELKKAFSQLKNQTYGEKIFTT